MVTAMLRLPAVLKARGVSRSAHYADVAGGLFTRPVAIGARAKAWPEPEVEKLNAARIAGADDAAVKRLVTRLEAARAAYAEIAAV